MIHEFIVRVETNAGPDSDSDAHAQQVMEERIDYDEDYGFDYTISWEPKPKEAQ